MTKKIKAQIPDNWQLIVEECGKFEDVFVFLDTKKNKRVFVKLCSAEEIEKYGLIWEFVEPYELRNLGISEVAIEESFNQELSEKPTVKEKRMYIEETAEEQPKKHFHADGTPFSEKEERELAEFDARGKNLTINIGSKSKENESDETDLEALKEENEDLRSKLEIVAEEQLEKKMMGLGLSEEQKEFIRKSDNPIQSLKAVQIRKPNVAGTASLAAQYGKQEPTELKKKEFASIEDLILTLKDQEKSTNQQERAEAEQIIKTLNEKWVRASRNQDVAAEKDISLKEIQKETRRRKFKREHPNYED